MRVLALAAATAVLAAALGWLAALVQFHRDADRPLSVYTANREVKPTADAAFPQIEIKETKFSFGSMQQGAHKTHSFVVKNVGSAPLTLRVGHTTCKCTLAIADDASIAPGASTEVRLEWTASADPGTFRQTASLTSNDPLHTDITLEIEGEIIAEYRVEPPDFVFDKVTVGQAKSASVYVMAMFQDELSLDRPEMIGGGAGKADLFDVQIEPAAHDELPNPAAKSGVRVKVTLKPNAPIGALAQQLHLHTNLKAAPTVDIPIAGRVVGDISIHGENWDDARSVLRLGSVKSSKGSTPARLNILVRGPNSQGVVFHVQSCDPPELKATIGQPKQLGDSIVQVPLEIVVPEGTPPMVHLGTNQGPSGRVILGTTHPTIREIELRVQFSVER